MSLNNIGVNVHKDTVMYVAIDNVYVGCFVFEDNLKEDVPLFIDELRKRNINDMMILSGDKMEKAVEIARILNVSSKGELLPSDKVEVIKERKKERKIVYIGDGINDAPVLVESDVGVSMGTLGSDVAIEASDIVIVNDNPYKIVEAIDIARKTKRIIWFNIIFALVVKLVIMILAMFNVSSLPLAVFGDVGVTILTILNCIRINQSI